MPSRASPQAGASAAFKPSLRAPAFQGQERHAYHLRASAERDLRAAATQCPVVADGVGGLQE